MQETISKWGELLGEEMDARGLTNSSLARLCGCEDTTIMRIRAGKVVASEKLRWKIAAALGVRMDKLWVYPALVPAKSDAA